MHYILRYINSSCSYKNKILFYKKFTCLLFRNIYLINLLHFISYQVLIRIDILLEKIIVIYYIIVLDIKVDYTWREFRTILRFLIWGVFNLILKKFLSFNTGFFFILLRFEFYILLLVNSRIIFLPSSSSRSFFSFRRIRRIIARSYILQDLRRLSKRVFILIRRRKKIGFFLR